MASYKDIVGGSVKRSFAKNLQRKMIEYGLNQTELARRCGVTQSTMSDWYHGRVLPRSNRLEQLCEIFNCEPADLLGNVREAVDVELDRQLSEKLKDPEVRRVADLLRKELVESYQAISLAMSTLDSASVAKLAAYAEGLMAASSDKEKTS